MEKKQAQAYIKEVLSSKFDLEQFEYFIRNLVNNLEQRDNGYSGNLIPEAFREHVAYYKRIGKYTDPEGDELDILIVQTRSVSKLERARTALRNFVVRHLKKFEKQFALVAFYSKEDDGADWRLSLVKIDYDKQRDEKGKVKTKEELVPAKRFSFLVGEYEDSYTAQKQLLPLLTNTYSDPLIVKEHDGDGSIEGAFGIERVTDEFYEQYKELFLKLSENKQLASALKNAGLDPVRFLKKLLGQIVFLYFLQKKGWLGVPKDGKMGEGSKRFLQDRFEINETAGKNYFNDFLRHLFYAALAREHNDENIKYYFKDLKCKVPFLNGGLFEAEYDWEKTNINIPNTFFRNVEKNKAGDKGTGILDVFDRYNFTIKEDEPLEKEVAVDPEMLGKVFENMLEVTERKSKGAFYTPREIVHYMCQESLIHYLDNAINDYSASYQPLDSGQTRMFAGSANKKGNLKLEIEHTDGIRVPKEDIEDLIRKGHLALENDEAALAARQRIEQGEIKSTKQKLLLPETISQNAELFDKALANIKICDPAIGSGAFPVGLLHEIVTARKVLVSYLSRSYINGLKIKSGINDSDTMPSEYYFKRHAIQESIYGVDIDASAIDIARLRLWLSMIVEEEDYETIEALPNLDYKIVCGNSLIGLPENAMRNLAVEAELESLKEKFFEETDENQKKNLRQQINTKIRELLDSAESFAGYKIDFDFKLYFSEVWHKKNGFDVVVGNPPYLSALALKKTVTKQEYSVLKSSFETAKGAIDLYIYFFEKGIKLLNSAGSLTYISPNRYLSTSYGEELRKFIFNKCEIVSIIDHSNEKVFAEASTYPIVTFLSNKKKHNYKIKVGVRSSKAENFQFKYVSSDKLNSLNGLIWGFLLNNKLELTERIISMSVPLIAACQINATSTASEADEYHNLINQEDGYKLINTGTIDRYISTWGQTFLTDKGEKYLHPYLPVNSSLISANRHKLYSSPKIILAKIALSTEGFFDEKGEYASINTNCLHSFRNGFKPKYILAWLNSKLFQYIFECFFEGLKMQGGYLLYSAPNLSNMFINKTSEECQNLVQNLVDYLQICLQKSMDLHSTFFDALIDAIFFEIFFHPEIKAANKEIIKNLGKLTPISDEISLENKIVIVQTEFDRLYHPNHPIRNNLETLDSIEEVRIIKNALK